MLYSKDSTNPYGFRGPGGNAPGRHRTSRFDKYTVADRNRMEEILTEIRNELTVQIDDTTGIHEQLTYKAFIPESHTSVVNGSPLVYEFRGRGAYTTTTSLNGPVVLQCDGYLSRVIVNRGTVATDGTADIQIMIDGTNVLSSSLVLTPSDTTAVVASGFSPAYFSLGSILTVDLQTTEVGAEDLHVSVEVICPFTTSMYAPSFTQSGVPSLKGNVEGLWVCPYDAVLTHWDVGIDTTANDEYTFQITIDSTSFYGDDLEVPGSVGLSPDKVVTSGSLIGVNITRAADAVESNFRANVMFDKNNLDYKTVINYISDSTYSVTTNLDVPRYIPETSIVHAMYLTRGVAGQDGSTTVVLKDDSVEIGRAYIDSSTTYYDSTTCYKAVGATVAAGSYLTLDILTADSTNPQDLRCAVILEKTIPTDPITFADSTETNAIRDEIARLDSTTFEVTTIVTNLDSTVATILSDMTALDSTMSFLLTEVNRLDTTSAQIKSVVTSIGGSVTSLAATVSTQSDSISSLSSSVDKLDSTVALSLTRLDSTVSEVVAKVQSNESSLAQKASKGTQYINGHAVYIDSGDLVSSITTAVELGYLSDSTASIQDQLDALNDRINALS